MEQLSIAGLHIDWSAAVWCTTAQNSLIGSVKVSDSTIPRTPREGFKALGVWIIFDGHFTKEIAEREVTAWRKFIAVQHMLCNNDVELKLQIEIAIIMCPVINVPVLWQLDSDTHTMYPLEGSAGPHVDKNDLCSKR